MTSLRTGLDYYNMPLTARISEMKRMLKVIPPSLDRALNCVVLQEKGQSTTGRQRDLCNRMVVVRKTNYLLQSIIYTIVRRKSMTTRERSLTVTNGVGC
jgi:hypothetical protein